MEPFRRGGSSWARWRRLKNEMRDLVERNAGSEQSQAMHWSRDGVLLIEGGSGWEQSQVCRGENHQAGWGRRKLCRASTGTLCCPKVTGRMYIAPWELSAPRYNV